MPEVGVPVGLLARYRVLVRVTLGRETIVLRGGGGGVASIDNIPKVVSLVKAKVWFCEQKNLYTDFTGN
jgi:hypothetical protein